jgi:hypothetical protein
MADKTIVIRGEVYWAKLTGDARPYTGNPKYDKGPSWSVDITPDANSRKKIAAAGISDKLREGKGEKETRKETFLTLRQLLNRPDGKHNLPPKVKDASGRPWGDTEIGNGSIMDIMVRVRDYGDTTGVYYVEGMVLRHVPYESTGLEPLSEDDEFFGGTQEVTPQGDSAGAAPNADDLDEDIPF